MIEVAGLHKAFGEVVAVRDVSFVAADGAITGLLGPNGAGKSTVLRMIYGLLQPDGGSAQVDGLQVAVDPVAARRRLGVLPDARGLYPRLTAREHVRYFGRLHGLAGPDLERRMDAMIERLDMGAIADRRVAGFSQGERVKVALARALVHEPRNVLLDEPTNGLDVMSTRAVRQLVRELRSEGRCVVLSSHVMQEVSALCDTVVVIGHGEVAAHGTAEELIAATGASSLEDAFVIAAGGSLSAEAP
jgi:sodium transport system ATP-binding protein